MEVREARVAYDALAAGEAEVVPVGYKRTEVGVIPEDWDLNPLGSLIASTDYGSSAKSHARGDVPVLRMGNLQDGKVDWNDLVYTSDEREIEKYKLSLGDVLFNRTNTVDLVGKTSIFDGKRPAVFAGYLIRIKGRPSILEPRFLNFALNAEFSRRFSAKVLSVAVSQANINAQKLRTYPIPTPTFAEQEAIAEALSDTDALIESLEQLLAKKRHIKQGTMRELLTGKKRLPGFTGEWKTTSLGGIADRIVGGGTPSRRVAEYWGGDIPWMTVKDFACHNKFGTLEYITKEGLDRSASHLIPKGTLVTSTRMGLGKAVIFEVDVSINQDLKAVFLGKDMSAEFLCNWFGLNEPNIAELGSGSTVMGISLVELKKIVFNKPSIFEQRAIADALSDMDAEIVSLETRLAKARALKQGMMQELLTGRVRLVQPVSNVVPLPKNAKASIKGKSGHNRAINEAVVIAKLTQLFGSDEWPLARVRRTKLAYLLHRHIEGRADGFLKKAAGPYDPTIRYKGPEGVALKNSYVRAHSNGTYKGFVAADNIAQAETYFEKWYGTDVTAWLEQFRWKKLDELELLTTVDMAVEDLRREGKQADLDTVKQLIGDHPEWRPKLDKAFFSDEHIVQALNECHTLFGD